MHVAQGLLRLTACAAAVTVSFLMVRADEAGVRVRFGITDEEPTDWSGTVEVSPESVTHIGGWRFAKGDSVDGRGTPWVVWSQNTTYPSTEPNFEIIARPIVDGKPAAAVTLSEDPGSDLNPAVATAADGAASPPLAVADTADYESRAAELVWVSPMWITFAPKPAP